jgi:hypothetical protein
MAVLTRQVIERAHHCLTEARRSDRIDIDLAIATLDVTGVSGEPEVGVTTLTQDALRGARSGVVRLDLDGVAGMADVVWLMARGLARLVVSPIDLSLIGLPPDHRPATATRALVTLRRQLGEEIARVAAAGHPSAGDEQLLGPVLDRVADLPAEPPILWIDHLESPRLTARHPVDVGQLLWDVRARQQRSSMRVVLSCRTVAVGVATDYDAAFYGDGTWLAVAPPGLATWETAVSGLWETRSGPAPDRSWLDALLQLTGGHVATTLLAVVETYCADSSSHPRSLLEQLTLRDDGLTARAVQHARSLHRLGSQVLVRIANGLGPYEEAGAANPQEINRAVRALHLGGLITQPKPRTWRITNPLVAARLNGARWPAPQALDERSDSN